MASPLTVRDEIKALESHYRLPGRTKAEDQRWLQDWADDLAEFDDATLRLACRMWRVSDAKKFPSPGELIAKCRSIAPYRSPVETVPKIAGPVFSEEHCAEMRRKIGGLAEEIAARSKMRGPMWRQPGETETDFGRRMWPGRER